MEKARKDQPWRAGVRLVSVHAGEVDMSLARRKSSLLVALITYTLAGPVMDAGKHQPPGAAKVSHVEVRVRTLPV